VDADRDAEAAIQAAHAAIERDRNDALALALHGHILSYVRRDFAAAATFLDRARTVGPSCAWAWSFSSLTRGYLGDGPTAVTQARHAVRLSPLGPDAALHEHALSQAHYIDGDYEQAADWGRLSAAHNRAHVSNLRTLIASLVVLGRLDEARGYAQRLMRLSPSFRIAEFRSRTPLQGELRDQFAQRLRLGGLPE
jgi:tetratricopeptide (TPR) repeat protein